MDLTFSSRSRERLRGCLGLLCSKFFSSASRFLAKRFQLHALSSRKKGGVVRAPKEVLHNFSFLWSCSTVEFVKQSQTPPKALFRCKKIWIFATVALSFVCGKYCPIID